MSEPNFTKGWASFVFADLPRMEPDEENPYAPVLAFPTEGERDRAAEAIQENARLREALDEARERAESMRDLADNGGPLGGMPCGPLPWEKGGPDAE